VVGTSSGATTAAQVRSCTSAAELLASVLSRPAQPAGPEREQPPSLPMPAVFERMRAIGAAATSAAELRRAMGAFGLESDSVLGPGAGQRRAMVAARLPRPEWPDRPMIVVAVDAHTGELAAFDRDSGVDLADAVTASTALPGMAPTHGINGARYINGGVRSAENADLAAGYAAVTGIAVGDPGQRGHHHLPDDRVVLLARHQHPGRDRAPLPGVRAGREGGGADRPGEVGVVEHDQGGLAAELEETRLTVALAAAMIAWPVAVEPVNVTASTSGRW
jgi:predicted acylesterase/phospholipase RssA